MIDLAVVTAIVARDRVAGQFSGPAATPRNHGGRLPAPAPAPRR